MRKIVVGVDGSDAADAALAWAVAEAGASGDPVEAVVAWSFPPAAALPTSMATHTDFRALAEEVAQKAIANVDHGGVPVSWRVQEGAPARVLCDVASPDDLLVVGARGVGGFEGLLLGSVSRSVLHRSRCHTVVVRAGMTHRRPDGDAQTVVAGVDASANGRRALRVAIQEARRRHAQVLAIHACEVGFAAAGPEVVDLLWAIETEGQTVLDHQVEAVADDDVPVERRVVIGGAAKILLDVSSAADLLVVGATGHSALAGLVLGSVSTVCAERAACPVLIVPSGS